MSLYPVIEEKRLTIQERLDGERDKRERNVLGQFATPPELADDIVSFLAPLLPSDRPLDFLEPAIGTGSFYSALLNHLGDMRLRRACGFDIDDRFVKAANELWKDTPLIASHQDFTALLPPYEERDRFDVLITNPPYVRHHHLDKLTKNRLQGTIKGLMGYHLSQLAGLYCHFLLLAHGWVRKGGLSCWLIPSEFMDVNYGRTIKMYLSKDVTLLRIHRYCEFESQFNDALVSSSVVIFQKGRPERDHQVELSYGGTLAHPESLNRLPIAELKIESKWSQFGYKGGKISMTTQSSDIKIGDLFNIKRGLATGDNDFFVLSAKLAQSLDLPSTFLRPILPSPRHLKVNHVKARANGAPDIANMLYLLDCSLDEGEVEQRYPTLWAYLQRGVKQGVNKRYLCSKRTPWYQQENRPAAPLLCTYMGRSTAKKQEPFRFILNESNATAANSYLMLYPNEKTQELVSENPDFYRKIWAMLNGLNKADLTREGRVYGGGLHKLEPKELKNVRLSTVTF